MWNTQLSLLQSTVLEIAALSLYLTLNSVSVCDGYVLHCSSLLICTSLVDCGYPLSPINGHLGHYSSTKEGTNVKFQCNEGYVPSIVKVTTCNSYGVWYPSPHEHNCTLTEGN